MPHTGQEQETECSSLKDVQLGDDEELPSANRTCFLITESAKLTRTGQGYCLVDSVRIKNIPPLAIGFLDLANSGDFAANIFNQIPVPIYATVLMVLGATCALIMSYIAFRDARRSFRNIRLLHEERILLSSNDLEEATTKHSTAVKLEITHRDLWTEIFDRGGMEILMGFAAFLIAVGTYMAPGGANPRVFQASNLLSGYIGNAPAAGYGLITFVWSVYVWMRARRQALAARSSLKQSSVLRDLLRRTRDVREHAILTGVTCIVSGVLGMFTPTYWWPYPVLAVCGVAFLYATFAYRTRIGYERPQIALDIPINKRSLLQELTKIESAKREMSRLLDQHDEKIVLDTASLPFLLNLVMQCDLIEHLTNRLINDRTLSEKLFAGQSQDIVLTSDSIASLPEELHQQICKGAHNCLVEHGLRQLSYRKRFLLEALGSLLTVFTDTEQHKREKREP